MTRTREERRAERAASHHTTTIPEGETQRVESIRAAAARYHYAPGIDERARRAIDEGMASADFDTFVVVPAVRESVQHADRPQPLAGPRYTGTRMATGTLGLSRREAGEYSLCRGLAAMLGTRDGTAPERSLEIEASDAIAAELGRRPRGLFVPAEDLGWPLQSRAVPMGVSTPGTVAAGLVGTTLMAGSFIEALRPATLVLELGATTLPGLTGNVEIPKQTGRATTYWIGEDEAPTESETPIGTVNLTPRSGACDVPITRRMILQGTPAVENIVRNDIVRGVAEAIDLAAFTGSGSGAEPLGILNHAIGEAAVSSDGAPTWLEALEFERVLAAANVQTEGAAFVVGPLAAKNMQGTPKATGWGEFIMAGGMVGSYRARVSNQLSAATDILFGQFSQLLIAEWGVLDVMVDIYSASSQRRTILRVTQDIDIALRHAEAFVRQT